MKTETRKSSAALKFQLLKFSGKVAVPLMLLAMALPATKSYAGSATWQLSPRNGDWNKAGNWMPRTVPNGEADIATLELSSTSEISVSDNTTVSGIVFNAGASPFTVAISPPRTLSLTGVGITNDSGILQNFVADTDTNGNRGIVSFFNTATAGSLTVFTNNGSIGGSQDGGHTEFHDASSAGSGTFISNAASFNGFLGGQTEFHDSSSASNGVFIANGGEFNGGMTQFFDFANAADGSFTTNGGSVDGGSTFFFGGASAGSGTFTTNGAGISGGDGGETIFYGSSTADHGTFIINGGTATGADGGQLDFLDSSSADNATIIINSGNGGTGASCGFGDDSDGGTARVQVFGGGLLFIVTNTQPFALGSIEGDGSISTAKTLEIGGNNLSTVFSGVISAGGNSPVEKVGTGTLSLSGPNTYLGGTVLMEGALKVDNATGSGTGKGPVTLEGGTLGGMGIIAGTVTVGTGRGNGAFLEPSIDASRPTTFTIQSALTFKADGAYVYQLNTKKARADQVVANGVTIENGAQFNFTPVANKRLRTGSVFTAISNTSASAITGTFADLPEGSIFTVGRNNYQISYNGGDGNDLTLTVVP
jgi:autotransporter-associated beta strand protein